MNLLDQYLKIKTSTLPGSGKGLFTTIAIPKNTFITEYKGKISTWEAADHDDGKNPYIYYISRNHVIDAKGNKDAYAHFANDAKGFKQADGIKNNSKYVVLKKKVYIKSIKNIEPGEEIFVGYGKEYWNVIRKNKVL